MTPTKPTARISTIAILFVVLLFVPDRIRAGEVMGRILINSEPAEGAVVYLSSADGRTLPSTPVEKTVRQENIRFSPDFLIIPVGSTLRFENHDDEIHNVYSSAPENRFDTGGHVPHTVKTVTLKNPGAVPIRCRTHSTMRGLIYVAPSPYFAMTDELGRFKLSDLPMGTHRIMTWHPRLSEKERSEGAIGLELDGEVKTVELRFQALAVAGVDLTGTADTDWSMVVNQIRDELTKAVDLWKNGGITPATAKVMSARSRLYGESGFREAIVQRIGRVRAEEHARRLDTFRKKIQGIGGENTTETELRSEINRLIGELKKDAETMSAPDRP